MKIQYQKPDGRWKEAETDRLSVFSEDDTGIIGILEQDPKKFIVATRGEPLFDEVIRATSQKKDSSKETSTIKVT